MRQMSRQVRTMEEAAAYARTKRCVIVGCAGNVQKHLLMVLDRMRQLGERFGDYRILIMENGSKDRTRVYLDSFAALWPRLEVHTATDVPNTHQSSKRLAHIRRQAVSILRERYSDWDYVVLSDMDEVGAGNPDPDGMVSCFMWEGWSFMAPNHQPYYDLFALRLADGRSYPGNMFDKIQHHYRRGADQAALASLGHSLRAPLDHFVQCLKHARGPVRVRVAFCARALYPLREYIRCEYTDEPRHCDEPDDCFFLTDCEHVSVSEQLAEATGLPGFVNGGWRPTSWEG